MLVCFLIKWCTDVFTYWSYRANFWCWKTFTNPSVGLSGPKDINRPKIFVMVDPNVGLLLNRLVHRFTYTLEF